MFYRLQTTQMNKKPPWELSLDLTLTQHPRDDNPEPWKVCSCFEIKLLQAWYYLIFLNSHTLVILLQVHLAFGNELKTIYEGIYEIEDTSIFAWFSILNVGHYHWLHNPINWLPPNNKANYLVHTIRNILNFLHYHYGIA